MGHLRDVLARLTTADIAYIVVVGIAYLVATIFATTGHGVGPDRMMILAERALQGRLDDPSFANTVDSVALGGRYYIAVGPLQFIPYLPLVPFEALHGVARYVVSIVPGLLAAWLALPVARAYGASGRNAYWVACFTAFGTLLFWVSTLGNMYYLAHAESFLALTCFVLEWAGRRRPGLLGLALAVSFLARPTTILAALPFGVYLVWRERDWLRRSVLFGVPLAIAILGYGLYNLARFGSPLESGYAISTLLSKILIDRRALGVFSIRQVAHNVRLALLTPFGLKAAFPYLVPDKFGLSMLLVSPGLLVALRAGFRTPQVRLLWAAAAIVAVPVFLYYGGGVVQYGFRYSLDFTPFLIPLIAVAVRDRLGWLERALFVFSAASVIFGIIWEVTR